MLRIRSFRYAAFLLLLLYSLSAAAQYKTDHRLERRLTELVKPFHGTVGIYVRNLKTGREAAVNADTLFPTASMIKIPIMIGMFNKIAGGAYAYHQELLYRDSLYYPGVDILGLAKDSSEIELSKVMMLMITESDNTAALWLQSLAGGGTAINRWLAGNGFRYTRMNSRTPGRRAAQAQYGWGQTTPREMAGLLVRIREGRVIDAAASERMYRNLTHIYWDEYALSAIPPYIQAASKQGAVNDSRSETMLVNAPHGDYVFCIDTKNIGDQRWAPDNEAWQLIRQVSSFLWHYFEPHYKWTSPAGAEKYRN